MEKNKYYYVADFETTTSKTSTQFSKVYLAGWQQLGIENDDHITYGIADFIKSLPKKPYHECYIYFHNGGNFDLQFILNYLINHKKFNQCQTHYPKEQEFYLFEDEKKIFEIKFRLDNTIYRFRDSYLLIGGSIKAWGEILKVPKLHLDYDIVYNPRNQYSQEVYDYFHHDLVILNKALSGFKATYQDINPLSISGVIFRRFARVIDRHRLWLNLENFHYFRHFYYGGMVTYPLERSNQWIKEKVYVYDINSSYPSVQIDFVPCTQPLDKKPEIGRYCAFYKIYILKADIKKESWPAVLRTPNKSLKFGLNDYVKHVTDSYYYFIDCEWQEILKFYNIEYKIVNTHYFTMYPIFKTHIEGMYKQRQELKKQGNLPAQQYVKVGLNSCYGRFAMNPNLPRTVYLNEQEANFWLPKLRKKYIIKERHGDSSIGDKKCYILIEQITQKEKCSYIPLAAYISAKARSNILRAIYANINNFLYCDTDSIFLTKPATGIEIDKTKLGAWKLELIGEQINILQAKQYRICDKNGIIIKHAHGGVRESTILNVKNEQYQIPMLIKNGKLAKCKVRGGILLLETDVKLESRKHQILNKLLNLSEDYRVEHGATSNEPLVKETNYE